MEFTNERITILYGSQTGNAQDVAERIWRESRRYYFTGCVKAMDDYDIINLTKESCVIFICSTTGQGEEPDNMKSFWRFLLRKNLPPNLLSLRFAVLGLGDSSYVKFNFAAKRLNKRLAQLGGDMLVPLGLADDQHDLGYDAVVDPWITSLYKELLQLYPLPGGLDPLSRNTLLKPRWHVSTYLADNEPVSSCMYHTSRKPDEFTVTVKEITRTTDDSHFQDVRLIKLQTDGQHYVPGDVVVVRPRNSKEQVSDFQELLKAHSIDIPPNTVFQVDNLAADVPVPAPLRQQVTFQQLCEQYFDLNAVPRRNFFNILLGLTDNDLEKEKLEEFISAEGQDDLYNYCNRPRRNIVEVLQDFPHALKNITDDVLLEMFPPIKPREFSIASSFKAHKDEIHILLAVVQYKTKLVKERMGLCSNYLANLRVGDHISVWIKKGSFKFPVDPEATVIMVGPGTGMAPFRSFICEWELEGGTSADKIYFFFGCRGQSDFHCRRDFERLQREKKLTLICAFSRETEHKVYVQHKIEENGDLLWELLRTRNVYVFVAGNAKNMPRQVREAFVSVCKMNGGMANADAFIENMEKTGRYQTETW
uniref:NADPH-dependent diflavin oxidoreductase 1 n=3 Tax=Photinus pyralis TaxID=7054 RepID=A0A1Y1KHU1_PHOPY